MTWQKLNGTVIKGFGVASGKSAESPYPAGSIALQKPVFLEHGIDLRPYFSGTLNISIAPITFEVIAPRYMLRQINWIDLIPPEDFSFSPLKIAHGGTKFDGLLYYPHPDTKPAHIQSPSTLEVLAPYIPTIAYGDPVVIWLNSAEIHLSPAQT